MYGQTGSGKTYTMTSIEDRVAYELFSLLEDAGEAIGEETVISMKFVELAGKRAFDLLGRRKGEEVRIVEDMNSFKVERPVEEEAGEVEGAVAIPNNLWIIHDNPLLGPKVTGKNMKCMIETKYSQLDPSLKASRIVIGTIATAGNLKFECERGTEFLMFEDLVGYNVQHGEGRVETRVREVSERTIGKG